MLQLSGKKSFTVAITFLVLFLATSSIAQSEKKLLAAGCVTEYYLMQDLVDQFNSDELTINILKTGNMKGLKMFVTGKSDFAFLSTPHTVLAAKMGIPREEIEHIKSIEIANEPILVVVNPAAGVSALTKEQIIAIYNGEIKSWNAVGGADLEITPASLNEHAESGLWAAFKKVTIGMSNNFQGKLIKLKDPQASKYFLKQKKGGIIYMGFATFDESVGIALSINGVEPTMENFRNSAYPFVAKYYLAYNKDKPQRVQSFIDFIFRPEGKSIINRRMIAISPLS